MANLNELSQRYNKLVAEADYRQRKRVDEANKIVASLKRITPEDVETLSKYVPDLRNIVGCTVEDLLANEHNEIERINEIKNHLEVLMDGWLKHYEEGLC